MATTESSESTRKRRRVRLRRIVVSEHNYFALKRLGYAGDSFNDVISKLLRMEKNYQELKKQEEEQQQENSDKNSSYSAFISTPPSPSVMSAEQNKQKIAELIQLLRGKQRRNSKNNQTITQESNSTTEAT